MSNSSNWPQIGPYQMLPLRLRVDPGVMTMNMYSFPQIPGIIVTLPSDCLVLYLRHSLVLDLIPLQGCSWCILQPQSTWLRFMTLGSAGVALFSLGVCSRGPSIKILANRTNGLHSVRKPRTSQVSFDLFINGISTTY